MNRSTFLEMESGATRRSWAARTEFRAQQDGSTLTYDGYASVTEHAYDVYGGPPYGWSETISQGAFRKTLKEGADVAFLINHDGLTLARTKSGTLDLREDKTGLRAVAKLDARMNIVHDLQIAVERGDVDEMSFAFRVVKDEWFDDNGDVSNEMTGTQRRITEVNLDHGDVSAVNYGANPATSGGFRALDLALSELRSGRIRPESRGVIEEFAKLLDENIRATEITPTDFGPHQFEPSPDGGECVVCGQLESDHVGGVDPTGTPGQSASAETLDVLRLLQAHHAQLQPF